MLVVRRQLVDAAHHVVGRDVVSQAAEGGGQHRGAHLAARRSDEAIHALCRRWAGARGGVEVCGGARKSRGSSEQAGQLGAGPSTPSTCAWSSTYRQLQSWLQGMLPLLFRT